MSAEAPQAVPGTSAHAPAPLDWRPWLAILAVAAVARLTFVAIVPPVLVWSDARDYDAMARLLVDHHTYGPQTLRPPGYPTLMAATYLLFGKSLIALRVVEALLATIAVGILGATGLRLFGSRAGLLAAALMALHPVLAFLPSTGYPESTTVFAMVVALWAAAGGLRQGGGWRWALTGAFLGLALLVRANLIVMIPGLAVGAAFALARERRGWIGPLAICGAALALVLAPWVVRNHYVHGRWGFVATGGGRQFWYANNAGSDGSTRLVPMPDSATNVVLRALPSEYAAEDYFYRHGLTYIREHPARAARLYLIRLGNLFALYPEPVTRAYVNAWSRWAQALASLVVYAGALLALRRWRTETVLWPMVAGIATFSLVNALYFMNMRYRMAFEPCLLLMAGLGYGGLLERLAVRRRAGRA